MPVQFPSKFKRFSRALVVGPLLLTTVILVLAGAAPMSCSPTDPGHRPPSGDLNKAALDLSRIDPSQTHILIEKTKYRLHLYQGDSLLKTYASVFGSDLGKDKYQEGDGRTPEGFFRIQSMYDHDKWTKFIWIDYPNEESRRRFNRRMVEGMIPKTARIGGEIGIHGVPAGYDHIVEERQNWTLGCISLNTHDITELYGAVQVGTQIEIVP